VLRLAAFTGRSAFEELGLNEQREPAGPATSRGQEVGVQGRRVGVCGVVHQVTAKSSETTGEATQNYRTGWFRKM